MYILKHLQSIFKISEYNIAVTKVANYFEALMCHNNSDKEYLHHSFRFEIERKWHHYFFIFNTHHVIYLGNRINVVSAIA